MYLHIITIYLFITKNILLWYNINFKNNIGIFVE